jgi:protein-disulfide isomerase
VITRRTLLEGAALTLGGALIGGLPFLGDTFVRQAFAQAPAAAALLEAGPLGDQAVGQANAPVTIIEYASMTCSHCADFHVSTYPALKTKFIDTGKVRYILREFPLDPLAAGAFMLARCAGEGKYFPLVEILFQQQKNWAFAQNPIPPLFAIAKQHGFTEQSFEKCLSDQKMLDGIEETRRRGAEKFSVNSTPTFFINGKIFRGALTIDQIEREIAPFIKAS